jgi:hypothetical protein
LEILFVVLDTIEEGFSEIFSFPSILSEEVLLIFLWN